MFTRRVVRGHSIDLFWLSTNFVASFVVDGILDGVVVGIWCQSGWGFFGLLSTRFEFNFIMVIYCCFGDLGLLTCCLITRLWTCYFLIS